MIPKLYSYLKYTKETLSKRFNKDGYDILIIKIHSYSSDIENLLKFYNFPIRLGRNFNFCKDNYLWIFLKGNSNYGYAQFAISSSSYDFVDEGRAIINFSECIFYKILDMNNRDEVIKHLNIIFSGIKSAKIMYKSRKKI